MLAPSPSSEASHSQSSRTSLDSVSRSAGMPSGAGLHQPSVKLSAMVWYIRRWDPETQPVHNTGSNPVSPTSTIPGQMQFQHIASDVCATYAQERHQCDCRPHRLADATTITTARYNDVASTAMRLLAGALRDSPRSSEQTAVNGWLGRADRRYSRTFAPPPLVGPLSRRYGVAVNAYTYTGRTSRLLARQGKSLEGIGPHFVVWSKQRSVRTAFHGVSIVSSKLFPSILT